MVFNEEYDATVRALTFEYLEELTARVGAVVPWTTLSQGFHFREIRIPLVSRRGIFKPASLQFPLTITTTYKENVYKDFYQTDGYLKYDYQGDDPLSHDNTGLRNAMLRKLPLAWFYGLQRNRYLAMWPVYVIEDHPRDLSFSVAIDYAIPGGGPDFADTIDQHETQILRQYTTAQTRVRIHQHQFRENVLQAYRHRCSICNLRHPELLEAAHIIPDSEYLGQPIVPNGLSLCQLHHGAFDRYLIGIKPDFTVEVRHDILEEHDGPRLQHAIQGIHQTKLHLPRKPDLRPAVDRLQERYNRFLQRNN